MMFKYCKKCIGMRQFRHVHGYDSPRQCDVCGDEGQMIPIKKKLRRDAEKSKLSSCPNCHKQHKWGANGDYCNMTCYYAELTRK